MLFVGLDKDGSQHCVRCGGQAFTNERATRVAEVLGVHATLDQAGAPLCPVRRAQRGRKRPGVLLVLHWHTGCSVVAAPHDRLPGTEGTPWW